ncbi:hypothetical protein [Jiella mangrovi]|uniref:Uncharacterized protein n=1 Tax=Jiella mangrovi TaxID=2821407 RepID=A0ABS4BMM0_9HYPH|nr:hypothetical protein [Jiella mangrovi]MBP0617896.1 hypothetical protein [Jiella mangrovi]
METQDPHELVLKDVDDQIDWVLENQRMSAWLRQSLRSARDRDPVDILNDLYLLSYLLKRRADAQIAKSLSLQGAAMRRHKAG